MHGLKSKSKTVYSTARILANNLHKERIFNQSAVGNFKFASHLQAKMQHLSSTQNTTLQNTTRWL